MLQNNNVENETEKKKGKKIKQNKIKTVLGTGRGSKELGEAARDVAHRSKLLTEQTQPLITAFTGPSYPDDWTSWNTSAWHGLVFNLKRPVLISAASTCRFDREKSVTE